MTRARFQTFIGVDLGGGKGKNTAVAVLSRQEGGVRVEEYGTGDGHPFYDDRLVAFLRERSAGAVVAIDAPLTLPACVRCQEPVCPGMEPCVDPTVAWFRARAEQNGASLKGNGKKPLYTPYTQRAAEVLLHEEQEILPRETLGQGMGPLTSRAAHLMRALAPDYRLNDNLIEVYPKATIWKVRSPKDAAEYKRWGEKRFENVLLELPDLSFRPWRERLKWNDHMFDAVICAYTAWLWARDGWQLPDGGRDVFDRDGWIWTPPVSAPPAPTTKQATK